MGPYLNARCHICENFSLTERLTAASVPFATFLIAVLGSLVTRQVLLRFLERKVQDKLAFAHQFVEAVRLPSILWCFALAIRIAITTADLTRAQEYWANKSIGGFVIVSM